MQQWGVPGCEEKKIADQLSPAPRSKGERKEEFIKSLDFLDAITDKVRLFNVCRRLTDNTKTRTTAEGKTTPGTCGLAFPAKMWEQEPGKWQFRCKCNWQALIDAYEKEKNDPVLKK